MSTRPDIASEASLSPLEYSGRRELVRSSADTPPAGEEGIRRREVVRDLEQKPDLRTRAAAYLESINPFKITGPKMPLLLFVLLGTVGGWSSAAIGIAAPEIQASFGVSVTALVWIGSATSIFLLIIGLPLGYLVDRVSRVRLVQIGQLFLPIGSLIQAFSSNFGVFLGGSLLSTVAEIPAAGAQYPLMTDYYPARSRARVFGFISIAGLLGTLIATPLVGWMVQEFGWRAATVVLTAVSSVVCVAVFLLREPKRGAMDRLDLGVSEDAADTEPPTFMEAMRAAWSIRTLRLQAIAGFVSTFSTPLVILLSLVMASKFALGPFERSLLSTLSIAVTIPATIIGTGIADRLLALKPSSLVAMQAGLAFLGSITLIFQAFAPNLVMFFLFSILPAITSAILAPVGFTISAMVVPARVRGVGMQVFTPFALVGALLAPVLLSAASAVDLQQAFLFFAPFMAISGLIYLASAGTVAGDIRAARAAALADQDSHSSFDDDSELVLVCRDLEARRGEALILSSIDLDVRRGEIVALVGSNGAGKSTLLKAICGLEEATNGAVFYRGKNTTHMPAYQLAQRGMAYLPGGHAVFHGLTGQENVRVAGGSAEQTRTATGWFGELQHLAGMPASDMSGGEQQLVAVAQSLARGPELLLVDEMTLGLAPMMVERLIGAVRAAAADGTTVVLVEQSLNLALSIADRVVFMDSGQIRFDGTKEGFLARPELVRSIFLGSGSRSRRVRHRAAQTGGRDQAPLLTAEGLTVRHGTRTVLDDVHLEVSRREVLGIIGPNGAGKSTLFDALSGNVTLAAGSVHLDGHDVTALSPDARARRGLKRSFQEARLFGALTVAENVAVAMDGRAGQQMLGAALWLPGHRRTEARLQERVDSYLDLFGLTRHSHKFVAELSTGMRRAVELACQLAAEPDILLLDEPSSGLAQAEVEALGPALQRIVRETDCGIVLIEHDLGLIESVSDRLMALDRGRLLATGTPTEVLTHPEVRATYLSATGGALHRSGALTTDLDAELISGSPEPGGSSDPSASPYPTDRPPTHPGPAEENPL